MFMLYVGTWGSVGLMFVLFQEKEAHCLYCSVQERGAIFVVVVACK